MLPTQSRNPLNRRTLLRTAAGGGWLALGSGFVFAASDFWNKKESSAWTPQEIETLKTKSPWAKKIHGEMAGGGSRGSGGGMGGGGRGGGGGGMGEGGGGGGGGSRRGGGGGSSDGGGFSAAQQGPEVVVRWENAAPMLEATKFQLPETLQNHYAISLTGLPPQMLAMVLTGARGGRGRDGKSDSPAAEAPTTPEEQQAQLKERQDRLLHSVTLAAKGKDPQKADVVMQTSDKQTLIFGFAKDALPLAEADKDVEFTMKAGPMTIKAKFEPKEMTYKGALTI
jgi:hypothetical protein